MLNTTIGLILVLILLITLISTIFRQILPKIAVEPTLTPAAKAWLDLWIPLITIAPLALTLALTRSQNAYQPLIWFSAGPATVVSALLLGLLFLDNHHHHDEENGRHPRWGTATGFQLRHALLLTLIGTLLALTSLTDRFTLQQGEACLFAAVLWIWMNSPASHETECGRASRSKQKKPKLVLDWAGSLRSPVFVLAKLLIALVLVLFIALLHYTLSNQLPMTVYLVTAFQGAMILATWLKLGCGATQRVLLSTLIFSILLGTGLLAVTRLHTNIYLPFWPASWNIMGPSVFLGMSSLRATGIFILGLALVTFLYTPLDTDKSISSSNEKSQRAVLTGLLLIAGAILIAMTGSTDSLHQMGGYVYKLIIEVTQNRP